MTHLDFDPDETATSRFLRATLVHRDETLAVYRAAVRNDDPRVAEALELYKQANDLVREASAANQRRTARNARDAAPSALSAPAGVR
jgi:hypothetical protein